MKKIILSLALLAGFASAANAQTGIKYGIKGGANISTFSGTNSSNYGNKFGFSAGVLANYGITDMFSLQLEALYDQKGWRKDVNLNNNSASLAQTLHYIDVPLLLKINTGDAGKGLFFEVGPQASFLIGQRSFVSSGSYNATTSSYPAYNDGDNTANYNKTLIGYAGGIGYQLTSGLGLGLRYNGDFAQVFKDGTGNPNVHNSVFQFQVHYLFGGKG